MIRALIFICTISSMWCAKTFGQTKGVISDERVSKFSNTLYVSPEKAKAIIEALDYKKELVLESVKDKKLKPADKRKILEAVVKERQEKLKTLLSPQQLAELKENPPAGVKNYYDNIKLKQAKAMEAGKGRNKGRKLKQVNRDSKKVG